MGKRSKPIVSGLFGLVALAAVFGATDANARDVMPWKSTANAIVIDAYEMNIIDWDAMATDKRIAGFISKASDGLPESFSCSGDHNGDTVNHCRTMWRKYAVSRELYQTRRMLARSADCCGAPTTSPGPAIQSIRPTTSSTMRHPATTS